MESAPPVSASLSVTIFEIDDCKWIIEMKMFYAILEFSRISEKEVKIVVEVRKVNVL